MGSLTPSWREVWFLALCALCVGPVGACAQTPRIAGDFTGPWQLMVDDGVVAAKTGVTRTYHPFAKYAGNPVMVADRAWEGNAAYVYGTVLPNEAGGGYRMWYHSYNGQYRILYATSPDGIAWTKPNLGLVDYQGSTANNILIYRTVEDHDPQVIFTPWETDPARRYKMLYFDYGRTPPQLVSGYDGAWSADGIHWNVAPGGPVLPDPGDVGQFVWDPHTSRYLGYPKKFTTVRGYWRRCTGYSATTTFESWPASTMVLIPDQADDRWATGGNQHTDFYGLSAFAYESMYLGFLWVFRTPDLPTGSQDGPIDVQLVSSRDGVNWTREEGDRPPILPLGPPGSWDRGMIFTTNHPLVEGNVIKLWYGGFDATHGVDAAHAAVGLATLRKDGFASLDAGSEGGVVTTKKLQGLAGVLRVNFTAPSGALQVEVLDAAGRIISGYSRAECTVLSGDHIDTAVSWKWHQALPVTSKPIRLRFYLQAASLFSFAGDSPCSIIDDRSGILYTLEGDSGSTVADLLLEDSSQMPQLQGAVAVDADPARAGFGRQCLAFTGDGTTRDALMIPNTASLGTSFTLAALVHPAMGGLSRLFSSNKGGGTPGVTGLVFEFDPQGVVVPGLRCVVHGVTLQSSPSSFLDGKYHHLALTSDAGAIVLYLDGQAVGSGSVPAGPVLLDRDLVFGADPGPANSTSSTLPLAENFETQAVGSPAGWEAGDYPALNVGAADAQLAVIATEASPAGGGGRSLRWHRGAGPRRGGFARRWGPMPSGNGVLRVAYDFKLVGPMNRALSLVVSGWDAGDVTNLNVFNLRFDPTTADGLPRGFNYRQNDSNANIVPVADVNQVVGHWFHFESVIDVAARSVDLTIQQLDGPLGISHYPGSFQTALGVNPLDQDLANYQGVQIFQSAADSDIDVLIDNFSAQVSAGSAPSGQFAGWADDILVLHRALAPDEIQTLAVHGALSWLHGPKRGDLNADGWVDPSDLAQFLMCMTGPGHGPADLFCQAADLDQDGDVDQSDFGVIQQCFSEPLVPPPAGCFN